jgi:D-proline reductase (dithiol) PrdB
MIIHVPNTGSFRSTTEMEILEQPLEWLRAFQEGWLSNLEKTGEIDWDLYTHPHNHLIPNSRGINLCQSRVLLITTAGVYYADKQKPFKCDLPLGDYSIRTIPFHAKPENLVFSHPDFNGKYVREDPQVLLPLQNLYKLKNEGYIGSLAPVFVSFCGFQPHAIRVVKELVPAILNVAKEYNAHAAMIVPAGKLCIQSAGLVARALEVNNIASTLTTWDPDMAYLSAPPRLTATYLPPGSPLGMPNDHAQQRRVISATLKLLELKAPTGIIYLQETGSF